MQTPTRPVAAAYPWAAWPAPCSWRTRMWRIVESISGSYAGRIAPPGMPKMCSVPAASSDLTRLCAPVICSLIALLPSLAAAVRLTCGSCSTWSRPTKNPSARGQRGVTRALGPCGSAHASREYENLRAHAPHASPRLPRRHAECATVVPTSGTFRSDRRDAARSALAVAPLPRGHARLVALGVGEHPERRGPLVADQAAAGGQGRLDPPRRRPRAAPGRRGGTAGAARRAAPVGWNHSVGSEPSGSTSSRSELAESARPSTARQNGLTAAASAVSSAELQHLEARAGRRRRPRAAAIVADPPGQPHVAAVTPCDVVAGEPDAGAGRSAGRGRGGGPSPRPPRRSPPPAAARSRSRAVRKRACRPWKSSRQSARPSSATCAGRSALGRRSRQHHLADRVRGSRRSPSGSRRGRRSSRCSRPTRAPAPRRPGRRPPGGRSRAPRRPRRGWRRCGRA